MLSRSWGRSGGFRMPTDRTWSKQHPKIRTPRPLVDRFNLGNMHPNKEWWRERRIAPATFMGFPDVSQAALRGGSLYTEQMDAPTLSVIIDKCVSEGILDVSYFEKFSWRTQQIINSVSGTDVAYLFRGFSRADYWDSHLVLSLWGRIDYLLPTIERSDLVVIVQGYENARFRNSTYEARVLEQIRLVLEVRPAEWTAPELGSLIAAIGYADLPEKTPSLILRRAIMRSALTTLCSRVVDLAEITELKKIGAMLRSIKSLADDVSEGLSIQPLVRVILSDLRESGKLQNPNRARTGDDAFVILKAIHAFDLAMIEPHLVNELVPEVYENLFQMDRGNLLWLLELCAMDGDSLTRVLPSDWICIVLRRLEREMHKICPNQLDRVRVALENVKITSYVKVPEVKSLVEKALEEMQLLDKMEGESSSSLPSN